MVVILLIFVLNMYMMGHCGNQGTRLELLSIQDCDLPSGSYAPNDLLLPHSWTVLTRRGHSYVNVNFTIPERTGSVTFDIKGYHYPKGKKIVDIVIENISCRHPIPELILKKLRLKYVRKDCVGLPGNYTVPELSIDDIIRNYEVADIVGYGIYILEVNFHTKKGSIICLSLKTDIKHA